MSERRKGRGKSVRTSIKGPLSCDIEDNDKNIPQQIYEHSFSTVPENVITFSCNSSKVDLRKEYNRFCKLYSSEPLDIVAGPLEKASYRHDSVELDLKGRGLRGVDCIALGKILTTNSTIHHLNLSDCLLLPQGFQALLDGVGKNTYLKILELRGNNIQSGMVETLGNFLRLNNSVKTLLLEWNCLGISKTTFQLFCEGLAVNHGLEYLDLRNNQITDESGIDIAGALKQNNSLMTLDVRWNSIGVQGAKGIWDSLQFNSKMIKIELCGNFVPDEIVRYIETTLSQRGEKEAIIEDYSKRTSILTRQLQKTEDEYKHEINSIVTNFEDEEAELKALVREGQQEVGRLEKEIFNEINEKKSLNLEINKIQSTLDASKEKERVLQEALQIKTEQIKKLEQAMKSQVEELSSNFENKISKLVKEITTNRNCNDRLTEDLKESQAVIEEKDIEISMLQNRIDTYKQSGKRSEDLFEVRLRKERENWQNWKAEVESNEHQETKRLETQLVDLQRGMQEHVRSLEAKRIEAEEEVNRLRMVLLTAKTETEENLSRLRNTLNEEHLEASKSYLNQIDSLKQTVETLDTERNRLDSVIRKLENDHSTLTRQNDHLKQQNVNLENELEEKESKTQGTIQRVKAEARDLSEMLTKEEESNKSLRGQVLELQEQIAVLTMRLNRTLQERQSEDTFMKTQIDRRDEELNRLKQEDMRRAALLHDAFIVYMRSTSAATGLPIPSSSCPELHSTMTRGKDNNENNDNQNSFNTKGSIS